MPARSASFRAAARKSRFSYCITNRIGPPPAPQQKDLVGVDVYLDWAAGSANDLGAVLSALNGEGLQLASLNNRDPLPWVLPYAASKAAIVSLTKQFAGALAPAIRVNAVAPGWMEGDWMQRMLGANYDRLMERRAKATPLGRCVTADDVAEAMLSLISARFVNGEILVVDGGFASTT